MRNIIPLSLSVAASLFLLPGCKNEESRPVVGKSIERANEASENLRDKDSPEFNKLADEVNEGNKEINEAKRDVAEAQREVNKEANEAAGEVTKAMTELRNQMTTLDSNATTFTSNRDAVAATLRSSIDNAENERVTLGQRVTTLNADVQGDANKMSTELQKLVATARTDSDALSKATAAQWPKARDKALESFDDVQEKLRDLRNQVTGSKEASDYRPVK